MAQRRKGQSLRQEGNKGTAERSLAAKAAEPSAEERLAALHKLQQTFKVRRVDFDKWLQTMKEGRR
ncbi:MAG: hypothetical protein DME91_01150 [Verrucomicrobia bacterium]|nr:MAG: hypothetical protein DME91_01150 [Verrucomicrobiota bacterium]PYJ47131.1 MAG: hypothetical protein DME85_07225 [Verrucomicrobiota bacterium]PYK66180.1 MAG: hypothetical protein DME50_06440 [Verrucomicrobiota bacterium]